MRYPKDQKTETRKRIVETASRNFRKEGVAAVGVAPLMKDAGLTHGGFYAHFPSKEALVAETVRAGFDETVERLTRVVEREGPEHALEAIVSRYLDPRHRDHPENGCVAASLGPELARQGEEVRQAMVDGIEGLVALIQRQLPAGTPDPEAKARGVVATMMGALVLARATCGSAASEAFLEAGRAAVMEAAGTPRA